MQLQATSIGQLNYPSAKDTLCLKPHPDKWKFILFLKISWGEDHRNFLPHKAFSLSEKFILHGNMIETKEYDCLTYQMQGLLLLLSSFWNTEDKVEDKIHALCLVFFWLMKQTLLFLLRLSKQAEPRSLVCILILGLSGNNLRLLNIERKPRTVFSRILLCFPQLLYWRNCGLASRDRFINLKYLWVILNYYSEISNILQHKWKRPAHKWFKMRKTE